MWSAFVELRDTYDRTIRKTWKLAPTVTSYAAAEAARAALVSALAVITEATVNDSGVTETQEQFTAGAGELHVQALINVWAEDPANDDDVLAISPLYVPAPVPGIFVGSTGNDALVVDRNDTALQNYINQIASYTLISDMEVLDTAAGINGMKNGRRVNRKLPKPT